VVVIEDTMGFKTISLMLGAKISSKNDQISPSFLVVEDLMF
jgi:hypothetical protein